MLAGSSCPVSKKVAPPSDSEEDLLESFLPKDDSQGDEALAPLLSGGMSMSQKKLHGSRQSSAKKDVDMDTEDHDYVREHCPVPSHCLKTFAQVHGARAARCARG